MKERQTDREIGWGGGGGIRDRDAECPRKTRHRRNDRKKDIHSENIAVRINIVLAGLMFQFQQHGLHDKVCVHAFTERSLNGTLSPYG